DDHPVVRAGLRGMLAAEAGIEVAGEAASGPEAVAMARTGGFHVILMDLRMPGGGGLAATEQILAADPGARILILTTYETDADILRAVAAGATGYLLKDATAAELAGAVRAAARGETVLAPSVAERLVSHVRRPPRAPRWPARPPRPAACRRPGRWPPRESPGRRPGGPRAAPPSPAPPGPRARPRTPPRPGPGRCRVRRGAASAPPAAGRSRS